MQCRHTWQSTRMLSVGNGRHAVFWEGAVKHSYNRNLGPTICLTWHWRGLSRVEKRSWKLQLQNGDARLPFMREGSWKLPTPPIWGLRRRTRLQAVCLSTAMTEKPIIGLTWHWQGLSRVEARPVLKAAAEKLRRPFMREGSWKLPTLHRSEALRRRSHLPSLVAAVAWSPGSSDTGTDQLFVAASWQEQQ